MVGVHDFARLAERGAEDAHGVEAVGLDFEMDRTERLHDGYTVRYTYTRMSNYTITLYGYI